MNVYEVIISEYCKKQNRPIYRTVVQCESGEGTVLNHYHKQYQGFHVAVNSVPVVQLEIKNKEIPPSEQIATITHKTLLINDVKLSPEEIELLKTLLYDISNIHTRQSAFENLIKLRLTNQFGSVVTQYGANVKFVTNGMYPNYNVGNDWKISATIALNGSIVEHLTKETV